MNERLSIGRTLYNCICHFRSRADHHAQNPPSPNLSPESPEDGRERSKTATTNYRPLDDVACMSIQILTDHLANASIRTSCFRSLTPLIVDVSSSIRCCVFACSSCRKVRDAEFLERSSDSVV